jgi:hypothetical protein
LIEHRRRQSSSLGVLLAHVKAGHEAGYLSGLCGDRAVRKIG